MQTLTIQRFTKIKTQRCANEDCPVYKMFCNEVRARYYQLVFSVDKCCFNCFGYHTDADRRREPFLVIDGKQQKELAYSQTYMVDFQCLPKRSTVANNKQKSMPNKSTIITNQNSLLTAYSCYNSIQYLYHPSIYKTINCPFININDQKAMKSSKIVSKSYFCGYQYCPFLHKEEVIDTQLQTKLTEYRGKSSNKQQFLNSQKLVYDDKIMNIVLLRTSKSAEDFYHKQLSLIKKQQHIPQLSSSQTPVQSTNMSPALSDIQAINTIKQKLTQNVQKFLQIDKQKSLQQQSRKVVDPKLQIDIQNKCINTKAKQITAQEQLGRDTLGVSYNYFKYGEKLSLIQSRTVQFKHFKDISDPNHIPLIMRYITAFLNTQGGKMYIGVDDNSYVYGSKFKQSQYDKLLLNIDRECRFCLNPPLMPQKYNIKLIPVYQEKKSEQNDKQRWVIEISVFPTKESKKRLFLYNRECYMRMNASTHKLNASDIIEYINLNSASNAEEREENQQTLTKAKDQPQTASQAPSRLPRQQQVTFSVRQNQLINPNPPSQKPSAKSSSNSKKFQTQQSKQNQFQQQASKKSLEDLYLLKKQYEQKLMVITEVYKKKQRQMR